MKKDTETTIQDLREMARKFVNERNWKSYHTPRLLAEAISIESAELMEHFLFKKDDDKVEDLESFTDEMADIFIYLMSLSNTLDLPSFSQRIYEKMQKNKMKYPVDKFSGDNYKKQ